MTFLHFVFIFTLDCTDDLTSLAPFHPLFIVSIMVAKQAWPILKYFERSSTQLQVKMASQNTQYIQGPKMDWTEDADLNKQFKDWRDETKLLLDTVLSNIRN